MAKVSCSVSGCRFPQKECLVDLDLADEKEQQECLVDRREDLDVYLEEDNY